MLLAIDVGNTNIVIGVFEGAELRNRFRIHIDSLRTSDETGLILCQTLEYGGVSRDQIDSAIISSVAPQVNVFLSGAIKRFLGVTPVFVNSGMKRNITLPPGPIEREIGADLIVNAVAAFTKFGGPVIIVDYGTATKYLVVNHEGHFVTGVIAPGIRICADALFSRAALLGRIEIAAPPSIVATNTVESINAGIVFGAVGETEYIVTRLIRELGYEDCLVVATGGLSGLVSGQTTIIDKREPDLTLLGLRILWEMNA